MSEDEFEHRDQFELSLKTLLDNIDAVRRTGLTAMREGELVKNQEDELGVLLKNLAKVEFQVVNMVRDMSDNE